MRTKLSPPTTFRQLLGQKAIRDETRIWGGLAGRTWVLGCCNHLTSTWEEAITELELQAFKGLDASPVA